MKYLKTHTCWNPRCTSHFQKKNVSKVRSYTSTFDSH